MKKSLLVFGLSLLTISSAWAQEIDLAQRNTNRLISPPISSVSGNNNFMYVFAHDGSQIGSINCSAANPYFVFSNSVSVNGLTQTGTYYFDDSSKCLQTIQAIAANTDQKPVLVMALDTSKVVRVRPFHGPDGGCDDGTLDQQIDDGHPIDWHHHDGHDHGDAQGEQPATNGTNASVD